MKSVVALALILAVSTSPALAVDPAAGETVFKKCAACHMVGAGAKNRVGPVLNGIIGGPMAAGDFKYSKILLEYGAEGRVWDEAALTEWLKSPKAFAPGTKMSFAGLKDDDDIANVIAYMATFE
jgi:cytochrome c